MAKVTDLAISLQSGSDNTYYASWSFEEYQTTTNSSGGTSTAVTKGSLVTIKPGSTYYNGVSIPSWVMSDQWYVTQVSGDRAVLGKNKSGSNNIQSPIKVSNLEVVGSSSSSGSTTTTTTTKTLSHYAVAWAYDTGDGLWFTEASTDVTNKYAIYSPPGNAIRIKVTVKPVSKTYKENDKDKTYWTGESVSATLTLDTIAPPEVPPAPSVKIEQNTLTAVVDNVSDPRTEKIQFEIYDGTTLIKTETVPVQACMASYTCAVTSGGSYRVRCRSVSLHGESEIYSEWTSFTSEQTTAPDGVTDVKCAADSSTSVKVTWTASPTATSYTVEYTTRKDHFDTSSEVRSTTVEQTTAYITGLDSGETWFFRVRASNAAGESGWSAIVSTVIGTTPEAPTTWSLSSSVIVGEEVTLYWTHNSEDGSKQISAEIQLDINGTVETIVVEGIATEDEDEPIYSYTFGTQSYTQDAEIRWKVRTMGITNEFGPWSTVRTIKLHAMPSLDMTASQISSGRLTSLPIDITLSAGPNSQKPLSYHISIIAKNTYESNDIVGTPIIVSAGTEVYAKSLITSDYKPRVSISAGDIILENSQSYTLTATVSMDSGLTVSTSRTFSVSWATRDYSPDAAITIDKNTLTAHITPSCRGSNRALVSGVTLAVYRREYNGTFTPIGTGISNSGGYTVTDPHPSLDYARYRIVAIESSTGNVSYEDLPGEPIGEPSIVIQWDEPWTDFDHSDLASPTRRPTSGSIVKLPYNVDVTENSRGDVSLVEYIGREHPVSYYGTQRGITATWAAEFVKSDRETLYALRRLATWRGDVYVREPSGIGYWALVTVSFQQKHTERTVPVTFEITRVEGGA